MNNEERIIELLGLIREESKQEFNAVNQRLSALEGRMTFLERRVSNIEKPLGEPFAKLLRMVSTIHDEYLERHPTEPLEN